MKHFGFSIPATKLNKINITTVVIKSG